MTNSITSYKNGAAALKLLQSAQGEHSAVKTDRMGKYTNSMNQDEALNDKLKSTQSPASIVTISDSTKTIDLIKNMAQQDIFQTAAQGNTDDRLRSLVRDGKIPTLPENLTDDQRQHLSAREISVYSIVSGLQSIYDSQPKSLQQALDSHVNSILKTYPDMIAREKAGFADGTLKESSWSDIISGHEAELEAAQQGKMKIQSIDDPSLVRNVGSATMKFDGIGFSGGGISTQANIPALQNMYNNNRFSPGSSPYIPTGYVITW